ncbi:MAG: alkylation response protein AidB-like acyl-CoA dehydrogenase [Glaciecola sp.]|jgi:alkylation response protein AidB-like acyl-CoA dehydrogenase
MDFAYPQAVEDFRSEVREFINENWDDEIMDPRREGMAQLVDTPERREFMKKLAGRGWLGMTWPVEYGGKDMEGIYEYVLNEELASVGAPYIGKGVGIVGKTLIRHGSAELKERFLPLILNAEIEWAIGYTEPEAGSDLAALSMRAVRDQEHGGWRITGQKRFTTSAHFAEWYWLAVRTDPDVGKHKGVTLMVLPMDAEGIQVTDMPTIGDERVNEVFLDDVFVPDNMVVGEVGKGFYYVSEALDFERFTLFTVSAYVNKYSFARDWVRTAERDGKPLKDDPLVRAEIARLATNVHAAKMICAQVIAKAASGEVPNIESAMFKLWATQIGQEVADAALRWAGPAGALKRGASNAPDDGRFEHSLRYTVVDTVGAGTSEVQRNIIARRGLGLPVNNGVVPTKKSPAKAPGATS